MDGDFIVIYDYDKNTKLLASYLQCTDDLITLGGSIVEQEF